MRIAILSWNYPPKKVGGTEIATQKVARRLSNRGHEVLVVTTRDAGLPEESMEEGFRIYRVRSFKPKPLKYAFFCLKVLLILRKFRPDVVHAQALWTGLPALIVKKVTGKPYLICGHGGDVYYPRQFKGLLSKIVLRNADTVIALTEDMKKEMQKICSRDVLVIGNGVELEEFERKSKKEARHQLGMKDNEKVIIFVGTLVPVKGVKYLLEAISLLKRGRPATRLLIVGDGKERYDLEALVNKFNLEPDVTFFGRVDNTRVPEYLAASDVFVLPSLSEGFPVTIAEAMAAGLPVVSTRVRGLTELVDEGKSGFLVEPANSAQLAEKISSILTNDALQLEMSANNRAWARLNTWEKVVEKLEKIYARVICIIL